MKMAYTTCGIPDTKAMSLSEKHLGLATSTDGLVWTRYKDNPIFDSGWVEDMSVIKHDGIYYMFAEGRGDTAHLMTSADRITLGRKGPLDIRKSNGETPWQRSIRNSCNLV